MHAVASRFGWLSPDARLILAARALRTFAYGLLSVVIGLYLARRGLNPFQIGLILSLSLGASAALSVILAVGADRFGRRRSLKLCALLMATAGLAFALAPVFPLLILAALTGSVSASSGELGPFLALEQTALPETASPARRTRLFGLYNTVGGLAAALGALASGLPSLLGLAGDLAERLPFLVYALLALAVWALFTRLSPAIELAPSAEPPRLFALRRSRRVVAGLSGLFALDSLASGFVIQSLLAYWLSRQFGIGPELLGPLFFVFGLLQALSHLLAAWLAERIGLINTMVFTHLPANLLLMALPFISSLPRVILVLLARSALAQMDVPARQSYTVAVVEPSERIAAVGVTNLARSGGQALGPVLAGAALGGTVSSLPFLLGGGLKVVYDLALYAAFRRRRPPDELAAASQSA